MRRASYFIAVLLTACAVPTIPEGNFGVGEHQIKIDSLKRNDVAAFLTDNWAKFDKHAKDAPDMFTHQMRSIDWYMQVTPPFPTSWPLQQRRSVTYYAYAEYQELFMHGPSLSRSAPWAKVVLTEGRPAEKVILSDSIGRVVSGEGSVPISRQLADRKVKIISDGEAHLPSFVSWTTIPADASEVKAIREYYCQWTLTNYLADTIKANHQTFFEWLACPPRTRIPVLQELDSP